MSKLLQGDKSVVPENKRVLVPALVVQRNNVQEYTTKINQMLGKAAAPAASPSAQAAPTKK
jgi:hypothetical protein